MKWPLKTFQTFQLLVIFERLGLFFLFLNKSFLINMMTWKSEMVVEGHCLGSVKVVRAYERGIRCLQRMQLASKYLIGRNSCFPYGSKVVVQSL